MPHERIVSENLAGELIIHWDDDGCVVDIGMIWDDPANQASVPPSADIQTNLPPAATTANDTVVTERRVEGSVGGMISVPVDAYVLQPYRDSEGRYSIYLQLDRPRLNGLVRTLRRARNKAFGADE